MSIGKFFKKIGDGIVNAGKAVVTTIAPAPLKIGMAVVDKLTGGKGNADPEAARRAEEDRKFAEDLNAQTAQIEAENQQLFSMLGTMRSDSDAMFKTAMGGTPGPDPLAGLGQDFEGKELFDRYSNPQSFGAPQSFAPASGLPPDIAQALQQYGLDLDKLQMT